MKFRPCFLTCYHDNSYGHFHLFYDNRGELLWDKRFSTINSTWRSSFHPYPIMPASRSSLHLRSTYLVEVPSTIAMKNWEKRQVNWARLALSSGVFVSWVFCVVVAAVVLYFVGFSWKIQKEQQNKNSKCVKSTIYLHIIGSKKKSESYEKSANTHSTTLCMYISICIHEIQNYAFASP